jgi:hypothetical protein
VFFGSQSVFDNMVLQNLHLLKKSSFIFIEKRILSQSKANAVIDVCGPPPPVFHSVENGGSDV